MASKIYSLYVINKSGGLIFHHNFLDPPVKLKMNDCLVLASMFHGLNAIASSISPVEDSKGIQMLEGNSFRLYCLSVPTGSKMFVVVENSAVNVETALMKIYELYSDYVLKNPFYELEMPIRCDMFNIKLEQLMSSKL